MAVNTREGIVIAGNIIVDIVKDINLYPKMGMLAYISNISSSVGGCVPNTAINLAKIDKSIPLSVIGKVGTDENGKYSILQLEKYGIDVKGITFSQESPTSFCDVMSMPSGERTFFSKKGASSEFSPDDICVSELNCSLLHIGYILLLDMFDADDKEYGTVMARFLHDLQMKGIKTSIDVVSDSTADYGKTIIPALKYCNYVIINEVECCSIWQLDARTEEGKLCKANIKEAMKRMIECGVSDKVIIHSKEAAFIMNAKTGAFYEVPSLDIPAEEIKGSVGAGDAFCAGCLYAIYNDFSDEKIIEFASVTAACSLFAPNSIDGMKPYKELIHLKEKYERILL